jgi:GMP synthase-like glutamine amidotransferase
MSMTSHAASILVLTHSELDGPGLLEPWAAGGGYRLELCRADAGPPLPDPRGYDALVVLGSVESARNGAIGWVRREQQVVDAAIGHDVPVLGICFGGQMLAQALGGRILACDPPEVGWQVIETSDPAAVPAGPWLLWHGERFTVPAGGQEIARSAACPQAFRYGRHLGLQFHPEVTAELLTAWVDEADGRGELSQVARGALLPDGGQGGGVRAPASPERALHLFSTFARGAGLPEGKTGRPDGNAGRPDGNAGRPDGNARPGAGKKGDCPDLGALV